MRFTIERTCLSETAEWRREEDSEPFFVFTEARDVDEAIEDFLRKDNAELEEVQVFPGGQAIASVKKGTRVYMLQFAPDDGEVEEAFQDSSWMVRRAGSEAR